MKKRTVTNLQQALDAAEAFAGEHLRNVPSDEARRVAGKIKAAQEWFRKAPKKPDDQRPADKQPADKQPAAS